MLTLIVLYNFGIPPSLFDVIYFCINKCLATLIRLHLIHYNYELKNTKMLQQSSNAKMNHSTWVVMYNRNIHSN